MHLERDDTLWCAEWIFKCYGACSEGTAWQENEMGEVRTQVIEHHDRCCRQRDIAIEYIGTVLESLSFGLKQAQLMEYLI